MLVEGLINERVELQGFRVLQVQKTGFGLEAELVPGRRYTTRCSTYGKSTVTERHARLAAFSMCRCGESMLSWSLLPEEWSVTAAMASISTPCPGYPASAILL
jgi:hypothetical protein